MLNDKMKDINCTNWVIKSQHVPEKEPNDIYVFFISICRKTQPETSGQSMPKPAGTRGRTTYTRQHVAVRSSKSKSKPNVRI